MNHIDDLHWSILDVMVDGTYVLDRDLIVRYQNRAMADLLKRMGLPSDLVGRKFTEVFLFNDEWRFKPRTLDD